MRSQVAPSIDYVIFHEMAHHLEKRHDERFWTIVARRFENPEDLERDLFIYWFRLGGDGWGRHRSAKALIARPIRDGSPAGHAVL